MGKSRKGMLFVLMSAVMWGSSGVCAQYIMEVSNISSASLTMLRLLFSGLILLTLSLTHGDKIFAVFKQRDSIISLLLFTLFGGMMVQLTFLLTIEKSNAATATVLQFLSPTIIVAWYALVKKKPTGKLIFAAIATSLTGTFLLVTHGNPFSLSISGSALFWGIVSAFSAAFYTTYPSGLIARFGTLPIVGWSMLLGGIMLTPFYATQVGSFTASGSTLLAFFYLIIVGTAMTFSLYLTGAQLIGGQKASILSCAEPLSSAMLSVLLLGITFSLPDWLGSLFIISSVLLIALDSRGKLHSRHHHHHHQRH